MRKRSFNPVGIILVAIVAFGLTATSCSWFGGEDNKVVFESNVQEKRVGMLKSLGGMSVGEGTHLLELDNQETMRLRSLNIDLDNEKYLGNKVEVRGPIAITSDDKELMDVQSIDLAEEEEEEEDVVGVETEYKNTDLGIQLTYLDSWELTEEDTRLIFTAPASSDSSEEEVDEEDDNEEPSETDSTAKQDVVIIQRLLNPEKEPLETFLELPSDPAELLGLGYAQTLVGTDQLDGLKKESGDRYDISIWLTRGEYVYQFTFTGSDHDDVAKHRNTFFSMVASFKFIGMLDEDEDTEDDTSIIDEPEDEPETFDTQEDDVINNPLPEETEEPEIAPLPEVNYDTTTESGSVYTLIAEYVGDNINTLAPEASENGSWDAYSFEFADPDYVYADYTDGTDYRRVLIQYDHDGTTFDTTVTAYFVPGETTSWERVSGENPVEDAEKTVVEMTDDGAEEATVVKEGYRYFESLPYDFLAQYPSNWYFSGTGGTNDVVHHYGFSNEPVEDGNELVSIDIVSGSLPSGSSISVGSHTGVKTYEGDEVAIYIERDDGMLYKVHGDSTYESNVIDIAASIKAN
ncbi:hypothetical protein GF369_03895 [Candidatus Peregrinibacteria bacterium]|nr:hypothetical protein [Candidatus Peregrinibacteria bacterium]